MKPGFLLLSFFTEDFLLHLTLFHLARDKIQNSIVDYVYSKKLSWIGHVEQVPEDRLPSRYWTSKLKTLDFSSPI